ncbi:G2E3 ligase, partial [Geococcyx californianus]|nr:G2E3 ligase [Geococcyx californianus]
PELHVCVKRGATITCQEPGCDRRFHLPCAVQGGCVTQYFGLYSSFCWQHCLEQTVEAVPEENTTCLICLEPVEDRMTYRTMVCPVCKHAWFHRGCIQKQAMHAGTHCFCCPHCQNEYRFRMEMLTMGIQIPNR